MTTAHKINYFIGVGKFVVGIQLVVEELSGVVLHNGIIRLTVFNHFLY